MKRLRKAVLAGLVTLSAGMLLAGNAAMAQDKKPEGPNAGRGLALADQLCSNCHIVSAKQTTSAGAGIPSFRAIANKPDQTSAHIANILIKPHAPMPNMQLSRFEIMDIIAYLDQLRRPETGAPLLKPSKKGGKIEYPSPS